jgi:ferric-dicitrate binding protein FerR (iron transport regulator)
MMAPSTEPTRAVRATPAAAAPLRPRPGPARAPARPPVAPAPPRRRGSPARALLALLAIAAVLAAGVWAVSQSGSSSHGVNLQRNVVVDNVQQAVDALKGLIDDNTG